MEINDRVIDFINRYILRKQEELDPYQATLLNEDILEVYIVKSSARRRKRVKSLKFINSTPSQQLTPPEKLLKLFRTPRTKKTLDEDADTLSNWLQNGWIIHVMEFKSDEKTVSNTYYMMGSALQDYIENQKQQEINDQQEDLQKWREKFIKLKELPISSQIPKERIPAITRLKAIVMKCCQRSLAEGEILLGDDFKSWSFTKKLSFLHFLTALYQLMSNRVQFDWKEVGAVYFNQIGGSKQFDGYKEEFLTALEALRMPPNPVLGLKSLGTIYPVYFSGEMKGEYAAYLHGTIHAATDHSVFHDTFKTGDNYLWIVENRGVLTRFAYEENFLSENQHFMLCVDGHIKLAHERLLQQLIESSSIQKVLIWTDYDTAGIIIARNLYEIVQGSTVRWVVPGSHRVAATFEDYQSQVQDYIKDQSEEQEYDIGGPELWKEWING